MSVVNQNNLQTAITNITAQLAAMTAGGVKPDYTIDGRTYNWNRLFNDLIAQQKALRAAIQDEDGAFEVVTYPTSIDPG